MQVQRSSISPFPYLRQCPQPCPALAEILVLPEYKRLMYCGVMEEHGCEWRLNQHTLPQIRTPAVQSLDEWQSQDRISK